MTLRFAASKDSFIWTDTGLVKIVELSRENRVLGLDGSGSPKYQNIISDPKPMKQEKLVRIISDCNEALIWEKQKVVRLGGVTAARALKCNEDKLELCIKPTYYNEVFNVLSNRPYQLHIDTAYLLGRTKKMRTEINNQEIIYFYTNDWKEIQELSKICWNELIRIKINPMNKIRHGHSKKRKYSYELKVKSKKFINNLNLLELDSSHVSHEIRTSSFEILCNYVLGLIQSYSTYDNYNYIIRTKITESEIRRLIYNTLPLFSNKTSSTSRQSKMINITIPQDIIQSIKSGNIEKKKKAPHFHIIKRIDQFRFRQVLGFETTGTNWSPVVDLLLLESSY